MPGVSERHALPRPEEKAAEVRRMFSAIARRYDLLNHLLSLNFDRRWRRRAVDLLLARGLPRGVVLDSCAGTCDLALELARRPEFRARVVACDFALPMLCQGLPKLRGRAVSPAAADALRLPFRDGQLAGAMVAFGIRNLDNLEHGLRELARVLRTGAPLVILEFATPTWRPLRALYLIYFTRVLPRIGRLISRHRSAYAYLPASVLEFPAPQELTATLRSAGFRDVHWEMRTGGIVAIYSAVRA